MAKTAEEILSEKRINFTSTLQVQLVHDAMREFAAQEVEEYKRRLKAKCNEVMSDSGSLGIASAEVMKAIIDTVK